MTDFRPDCTINLHVEARGKPAKVAWVCSITHARRGRLVLARRFLGLVPRGEAELRALLFGLRETQRLLQEKVEVAATFPLDGLLGEEIRGRRVPAELAPLREDATRLWNAFRLHRCGRLEGGEALALREDGERAFLRNRKRGES